MGGITSTNIDYATWGFLISTAALTVITYYYARQTRNLSRNQFRPYCYALLHPATNQGLSLFIRNNGPGLARNVRVEYSIKGIDTSKQTKSYDVIEFNKETPISFPLIEKTREGSMKALLHDKTADRIINVELTFSDILGTIYTNKHSFIENDFFNA